MKTYWVYILKCADGSYYTGLTNDLDRRIAEHKEGVEKKAFTYSRRPLELVYANQFNEVNTAIAFEKQLKGWGRKKKEALIEENWEKLKELAKCMNESSHLNK